MAHTLPKPRTWQAIVGVQSKDYAIQGMAFLPKSLWINVGDTVKWTVQSGDIHTVTFLPPGQVPPPYTGAPNQVNRVGGNVYNGMGYFNSGLMSSFPALNAYKTYALIFSTTGDFVYHCLVHPSMIGVIHVRPQGTPYPFSQRQYNQQTQYYTQAILHDGLKLAAIASRQSNSRRVTLGIGDGLASVVRFVPSKIVVRAGDSVVFTNRDVELPHTVTFGPDPADDTVPYGKPNAFSGQPLNSGFILFGQSYTVKFTKAGVYSFYCALHDYLGMTTTIVVLP
jgi:plastocyanin